MCNVNEFTYSSMTNKSDVIDHLNNSSLQPISNSRLQPTLDVKATDEFGNIRDVSIAEERPITIVLNKQEITTLMTLGLFPELLSLGYLRNQGLIEEITNIVSVDVDWSKETVTIENKCSDKNTVDSYDDNTLPPLLVHENTISRDTIYSLLKNIANLNNIYRAAGGVHGCAICSQTNVLFFAEDIGRHNAADIISGYMFLNNISGINKYLYCTGRLTSEIVIKAARMQVPILISRSGITRLGLDISKDLNITLIARAKGTHFLIYHSSNTVTYD